MPVPKKSAKKSTKSDKPARTKKEGVLCGCGCGEMTKPGRQFLQGHDARFKGRVQKVADGRLDWNDIKDEIGDYAVKSYKDAIAEAKKHVKPVAAKKKVAAKAKPAPAKKKIAVKRAAKPKAEPAPHSGESHTTGEGEGVGGGE